MLSSQRCAILSFSICTLSAKPEDIEWELLNPSVCEVLVLVEVKPPFWLLSCFTESIAVLRLLPHIVSIKSTIPNRSYAFSCCAIAFV